MIKKVSRVIGFLLVVGLGLFLLLKFIKTSTLQEMQESLALELGVEIDNFPYPKAFPAGYFYTVLQQGDSRAKVHEIVKGYSMVYHCADYSEIYYYFSTEDNKALRFEILYDEFSKFKSLHTEDHDSRTIRISNCVEGKIED
jgi:hypothetical protein